MLTTHRILLTELKTDNVLPLNRDRVIDIATRITQNSVAEIRIVVVENYDEEDSESAVELAAIELNSTPDGKWRLQYVSHPLQSNGLTAAIVPSESDFAAFVRMRDKIMNVPLLTPHSAAELEEEDLGPLASLNLRLDNGAPLVPSKVHVSQLITYLESASLL